MVWRRGEISKIEIRGDTLTINTEGRKTIRLSLQEAYTYMQGVPNMHRLYRSMERHICRRSQEFSRMDFTYLTNGRCEKLIRDAASKGYLTVKDGAFLLGEVI